MAAYENVSGFDIVIEPKETVRGPYHDIAGAFSIVIEPGQVVHILRGGGQSTTEWDWVRGKAKG